MNSYLQNFNRGFIGSFVLAASIIFAVYSTMVSFVKHEGPFALRDSHNHR